jgi:hypothetical protein
MAKGDKENFEIFSEHFSEVFSHVIMIRTRKCNKTWLLAMEQDLAISHGTRPGY